jgi:hypothetical protein
MVPSGFTSFGAGNPSITNRRDNDREIGKLAFCDPGVGIARRAENTPEPLKPALISMGVQE